MTLRLSREEQEVLRLRAQHEGRSMQEVARAAIREYAHSHSHREMVDAVIKRRLEEDAEMLQRLADQ